MARGGFSTLTWRTRTLLLHFRCSRVQMPYLAPQMSIASHWARSILSLDLSICVLSGCHQYQLGLHRRTALRGKSTVNLHGPCHRQASNMLATVAVGLTGCIWSLICPVKPSAYSITMHVAGVGGGDSGPLRHPSVPTLWTVRRASGRLRLPVRSRQHWRALRT